MGLFDWLHDKPDDQPPLLDLPEPTPEDPYVGIYRKLENVPKNMPKYNLHARRIAGKLEELHGIVNSVVEVISENRYGDDDLKKPFLKAIDDAYTCIRPFLNAVKIRDDKLVDEYCVSCITEITQIIRATKKSSSKIVQYVNAAFKKGESVASLRFQDEVLDRMLKLLESKK